MRRQAILILNGEIDTDFISHYIQRFDKPEVYCIDGAFNQVCHADNVLKNLKGVLGDLDSVDMDKVQAHASNVKLIKTYDQNFTDFYKALEYFCQDYDQLFILGFSGGEFDHALGNLHVALQWYNKIKLEFVDQYSTYFITRSSVELTNVLGKMVSVIPMFDVTGLTYDGLKYPLLNESLRFTNRIGTRNHAVKDTIRISFTDGAIMIFTSHLTYQHYKEEGH
jgi:thiamine pyrophosphokinase